MSAVGREATLVLSRQNWLWR